MHTTPPALREPAETGELGDAIERISPLTEAAWAATRALITRRTVIAGEHLLRAGEPARRCCFVQHGLLREYYTDADGRESTRQFAGRGEFSGSLADLLAPGNTGAAVSIEALTEGTLWEADWATLDALAENHPSLMKLLRRIAESLYLRKTRREFEMLTLPAAERYRNFLALHPGLDARLHRHQVASPRHPRTIAIQHRIWVSRRCI